MGSNVASPSYDDITATLHTDNGPRTGIVQKVNQKNLQDIENSLQVHKDVRFILPLDRFFVFCIGILHWYFALVNNGALKLDFLLPSDQFAHAVDAML